MTLSRDIWPGLSLVVGVAVVATLIADQFEAISPLVGGVVLGAAIV